MVSITSSVTELSFYHIFLCCFGWLLNMKNFFRVVLMMLLQHTRKIFSWEFRIFSRPRFLFSIFSPVKYKNRPDPYQQGGWTILRIKKTGFRFGFIFIDGFRNPFEDGVWRKVSRGKWLRVSKMMLDSILPFIYWTDSTSTFCLVCPDEWGLLYPQLNKVIERKKKWMVKKLKTGIHTNTIWVC